MLDKTLIKELYIRGLTSSEISKRIDENIESIQKCITRNFKEYKEIHNLNRNNYKETIKAVNKMNKKFISDDALLKMNRQSYKYDSDYNLIFNEERGKIPNDLPKKIKRAV